MKLYYNDVEITEATGQIITDGAMGAIDSISFFVPNIHILLTTTIRDLWEARVGIDTGIITAYSATDGDLLFEGFISAIGRESPLMIHCQSTLAKLNWYSIPEAASTFWLFRGKVASAPAGLSLDCLDSDGKDPEWGDDDFNGKYVIVSDSTLGTSTETLGEIYVDIHLSSVGHTPFALGETMTGANSGATGVVHFIDDSVSYYYVLKDVAGNFQDGEHVDGSASGDGDVNGVPVIQTCPCEGASYYGYTANNSYDWNAIGNTNGAQFHETNTPLTGTSTSKVKYKINLAKYLIPKTAVIQKIEITAYWEAKIKAGIGSGLGTTTMNYNLILTDNVADNYYNIKTYSMTFDGISQVVVPILLTSEPITIGAAQIEKYFNAGATYWEDGYFGFKVVGLDSSSSYFRIKLHQFKIKVYFDTETFEVINVPITDTIATDRITTDTNFATKGVAENDTVAIGESMAYAFANIFNKTLTDIPTIPPYVILSSIEKGISSEYGKSLGYSLWQALCKLNGFEYCMLDSHTLTAGLFEDFVSHGGTLTGFEKVDDIEYPNNKYGHILVYWGKRSGSSDPNPAIVSTGNDSPQSLPIDRSDILTYPEAYNAGNDLKGKYTNVRRSIVLKFKLYVDIRVGYRYDFSIYGVNYTDQICRRRTMTYNAGVWGITGYFGGGESPAAEKIARKISNIKESISVVKAIETTSVSGTVSRHNELAGIYPNDHHSLLHHANHANGESDAVELDASQIISGILPDAQVANDITLDNLTQITTRNHNDLQNFQGGAAADYYHYTSAQQATIAAFIASKGQANGLASLDVIGWLNILQIPGYLITGLIYIDIWDASSGSYPSPATYGYTDVFPNGSFFIVDVAGTTNNIVYAIGDTIIWDDLNTEWDKIEENDGAFRGYLVDAYKALFSQALIKKIEIKGKRPWEYRTVYNIPNDFATGNLPSGWSWETGGTAEYKATQDSYEKVLAIKTTTGIKFSIGESLDTNLNQHVDIHGWAHASAASLYYFNVGGSGWTGSVRFQDFNDEWRIQIYRGGNITNFDTGIAVDEKHQLSVKFHRSGGFWQGTAYIDGVAKFTDDLETTGNSLNFVRFGIAASNASYYCYCCAIGTTLLNSGYTSFGNQDRVNEGELSLKGVVITATGTEINTVADGSTAKNSHTHSEISDFIKYYRYTGNQPAAATTVIDLATIDFNTSEMGRITILGMENSYVNMSNRMFTFYRTAAGTYTLSAAIYTQSKGSAHGTPLLTISGTNLQIQNALGVALGYYQIIIEIMKGA